MALVDLHGTLMSGFLGELIKTANPPSGYRPPKEAVLDSDSGLTARAQESKVTVPGKVIKPGPEKDPTFGEAFGKKSEEKVARLTALDLLKGKGKPSLVGGAIHRGLLSPPISWPIDLLRRRALGRNMERLRRLALIGPAAGFAAGGATVGAYDVLSAGNVMSKKSEEKMAVRFVPMLNLLAEDYRKRAEERMKKLRKRRRG